MDTALWLPLAAGALVSVIWFDDLTTLGECQGCAMGEAVCRLFLGDT